MVHILVQLLRCAIVLLYSENLIGSRHNYISGTLALHCFFVSWPIIAVYGLLSVAERIFAFFVFMVALWNRAEHYIFALWFLLSIYLSIYLSI